MSNTENNEQKKDKKAVDIKFTAKQDVAVITEKDIDGNVVNEEERSYQSLAAEGMSLVRSQRNSGPYIDAKALKKIAKKHKVNKCLSVEEALKNEDFMNDISKYVSELENEMEKKQESKKSEPKQETAVSKILEYDIKCNELVDRCDNILKALVEANDVCSQKIEQSDLIVEQFNTQREVAQCSETGAVYEKFKTVVDAYQKQAEKAVSDARESLVKIKDLDTVEVASIRKELNVLIRSAEKDSKKNPDFKQVIEKANKLNDIIVIQRKQIDACVQKNESKLKGVKIKLNDHKEKYSRVLSGFKIK